MLIDKRKLQRVPLFGELLLDAGLVEVASLDESLKIARQARMPIGRVLVMSGVISQKDVDCTVRAQALLREGKVSVELMARVLRIAHVNQVSYEEALALDAFGDAFATSLTQLGKLLLAAGVCTGDVLADATTLYKRDGKSVGRHLVTSGFVGRDIWLASVECMILVQSSRLSRVEAVGLLGEIFERYQTGADSDVCLAPLAPHLDDKTPKLCVLLVEAGVISIDDAAWILEMSVERGIKSGSALKDAGFVDETVLEAALQLQSMLSQESISFTRASELLSLCKSCNAPLRLLLIEMEKLNHAARFLHRSGFIDHKLYQQLFTQEVEFESFIGATLIRRGYFKPAELKVAFDCACLADDGALSERGAFEVFLLCQARSLTVHESLAVLGWDIKPSSNPTALLHKTA